MNKIYAIFTRKQGSAYAKPDGSNFYSSALNLQLIFELYALNSGFYRLHWLNSFYIILTLPTHGCPSGS